MTVRYHQRAGQRIVPDYLCQHKSIEQGEPPCQRIPGSDLDRCIGRLLMEWVTRSAPWPSRLLSRTSWSSEPMKHDACVNGHVERAQYEADLAQRRYADQSIQIIDWWRRC